MLDTRVYPDPPELLYSTMRSEQKPGLADLSAALWRRFAPDMRRKGAAHREQDTDGQQADRRRESERRRSGAEAARGTRNQATAELEHTSWNIPGPSPQ